MNIICIKLAVIPDVTVTVTHNQDIVYQGPIQPELTITVNDLVQHNQLTVTVNHGLSEILDITFFDLGSQKLKTLGYVESRGQRAYTTRLLKNIPWRLDYEYPVFHWIHQRLDLGWCWRPDVV
jgi:hypothetical protein